MSKKLVLYVQENLQEDADAQVFIVKDGDLFKVFCTRAFNADDTPVPVSRLAFKSLKGVLLFLRTLISWRESTTSVSAEIHVTDKYDSFSNFNDLWNVTGPNTELGAWDELSLRKMIKLLRMLARVETEETWQATRF